MKTTTNFQPRKFGCWLKLKDFARMSLTFIASDVVFPNNVGAKLSSLCKWIFSKSFWVFQEGTRQPTTWFVYVNKSDPDLELASALSAISQGSKTHSDRAYEQKCSQVFEYQSPEAGASTSRPPCSFFSEKKSGSALVLWWCQHTASQINQSGKHPGSRYSMWRGSEFWCKNWSFSPGGPQDACGSEVAGEEGGDVFICFSFLCSFEEQVSTE